MPQQESKIRVAVYGNENENGEIWEVPGRYRNAVTILIMSGRTQEVFERYIEKYGTRIIDGCDFWIDLSGGD